MSLCGIYVQNTYVDVCMCVRMYVCCVLCMVGCVSFCIRDELPLSKDPPLEFATLPEFYLDDLAELLLFLSQ